jgi:RHS repeat-associated protein
MGKPAARMTDLTKYGGPIVQGSATVLIGDAGGKACSVCPGGMAVGSPVNPVLGAKVLLGAEDLDFALPGPMPVVWQRQYSSYVNPEHGAQCGLLGYGWKLGLEVSARLQQDSTLLFDAGGRVITFDEALAPGQALHSASEDLWIMRGGGLDAAQAHSSQVAATTKPDELLPWTGQARWAHVPHGWKADPAYVLAASGANRTVWVLLNNGASLSSAYRLAHMLDPFGRCQHLHYDDHGRLQGIEDGAGRRYALLYNQARGQDDKPSPSELAPSGLLGHDSGLRLVGVDCVHNPHDPAQSAALPGHAKPVPLVRYRYNIQGDLAEVFGRDGQSTRQFAYDTAHRLIAHRVRNGPRHSYVYEDQTVRAVRSGTVSADTPRPGARVAEQHNEEGLSYFFEYHDEPVAIDPAPAAAGAPTATSHVIVRDSLDRCTEYHFEGRGGDKRLTRQVAPGGSQEHHQYDGAGRRVATTDALGATTYWRYDGLGRLTGMQGPDGSSTQQSWGEPGSRLDGLVLQSTGPTGITTRYGYDEFNRLVEITTAAGTDAASTTRLEYVRQLAPAVLPWCDQPIGLVDPQGQRKTMSYDGCGQLASYTDCSNRTRHWRYDAWGGLAEEIDPLNQRVSHVRDALGRLLQTQRPDGSVIEYRWGSNNEVQAIRLGSLQAADGAPSATVTCNYDLWGRMVRQEQAGLTLCFVYDVAGRLTELVNENQSSTRFTYDARDRLVHEVGFDGRSQAYRYDAVGRMVHKTDGPPGGFEGNAPAAEADSPLPGTVRSRFHYDAAGRLVGRLVAKWGEAPQDPVQLELHQFRHNDAGQLAQAQGWMLQAEPSQPFIAAWLALDWPSLQELLDNPEAPEVAELAARLQARHLRPASLVAFKRDALGRSIGETQTLFALTRGATGEPSVEFEHAITHRLGPLGQRQGSQLHGMGQLDWLSYGSGHVHGVLFDQAPLIHLERDGLHREVARTLHLLLGDTQGMAGTGSATSTAIEHSRQLDPLGRMLHQRWQGLSAGIPGGAAAARGPASQPLVDGEQGPLGTLARRRYSYDALGQLVGMQTPGDATTYEYDAQQRLVGLRHASGVGESRQQWLLDSAGNRLPGLLAAAEGKPAGAAWGAQVQEHLNDPGFNLLRPDGTSPSASAGEAKCWSGNRIAHGTDAQGRLVRYQYDAHGNRVQAQSSGGDKLLMRYDALHQLTAVERWGQDGQMRSITAYRYDAFGRRLVKTHRHIGQDNTEAHYFGWDGDRLVHTEDSQRIRHTVYEPGGFVPLLQLQRDKGALSAMDALWSLAMEDERPGNDAGPGGSASPRAMLEAQSPERQAVFGNALKHALEQGPANLGPVSEEARSMLTGSLQRLNDLRGLSHQAHPVTIRHFLCDHLGSPIALVDANGAQAGQVTWAATYGAWGDPRQEYNPLQIDQPLRFQGQYFDQETGLHYNRFRYYDPAIGSYISQDPIALSGGTNFYRYTRNPIQRVDPLGLFEFPTLVHTPEFDGKGNTSVCSYYDGMIQKRPKCSYYSDAALICRGAKTSVNAVVRTGLIAESAMQGKSLKESEVLTSIRGKLVASDAAAQAAGKVDQNGCTQGNEIDDYHNKAFTESGVSSNFYGGNISFQGTWPNPVPLDPSASPYDPRRLWNK